MRLQRRDAIATAFLRWLSEQTHEPDPLEFLATPHSCGEPVMPGELEQAVAYANGLGLLRGHWRGPDISARVSLSHRGWDCVQQHSGDVAAWCATRRDFQ